MPTSVWDLQEQKYYDIKYLLKKQGSQTIMYVIKLSK